MTATPPDLPGRAVPAGPAGPADPQDVDVLLLAGLRPPDEGQWLLVTEADGLPGAVFSAYVLAPGGRHGRGGDVLIRLARAPRKAAGPEAVDVSVWAVISGRLVPVAAWDRLDAEGWPERVRQTAAFVIGVLTALEEHGADLRPRDRIGLNSAAAAATPGFPSWLTFGPPPAPAGG
jgi:hypothetical protein